MIICVINAMLEDTGNPQECNSNFFVYKGLMVWDGLNCVPKKRYAEDLTPTTCERDFIWTLFGNRVFADLIKLRWGHYSGSYTNATGVLVIREPRKDLDPQGESHMMKEI